MMIDWEHFTPIWSLTGGILIGVSAALLLLLNGRIAGISGILGELLKRQPGEMRWRMAFLRYSSGANATGSAVWWKPR